MSADHTPSLSGTHGLLRGHRTRSYGSLVSSSLSPVRQRRIEHKVKPGDTLQGLSLKYGVSMEQIKRVNRLYTNESIFLKESLVIPVLAESLSFTNGVDLTEDSLSKTHSNVSDDTHKSQTSCSRPDTDLSPVEYLKQIDSLISQSKQAAIRTCQEEVKQFSCMEQLHYDRPASITASSQQPVLGAVPITITKRTRNLRDRRMRSFSFDLGCTLRLTDCIL